MHRLIAFVVGLTLSSCSPPTAEDQATGIVVFSDPTGVRRSIAAAEAGDRQEAYKLFLHYQEVGEMEAAVDWLEVSASRGWPPAIRDRGLLMLESQDAEDRAEGRARLEAYLATTDESFVGDRALISHEKAVLRRRLSGPPSPAKGG